MRSRVDQAARLYREGWAPAILCSGGLSGRESEARAMRALLIERGVPAEAVIPDDHGISTRQALRSTKRFGRGRFRRLIAVSSPYHLHRIAREGRRQGLAMATCPSRRDDATTWRHVVFDLRQHVREILAVWAYAVSSFFSTARDSLPVRAGAHLRARARFLVRGADDIAASSAAISQLIKSSVVGFSDTLATHTPASGLHWPALGLLGHRFGMRHGRLHAGVDLRAGHGAPVHAAASGHVLFAGWLSAYGNVVLIHHGGGLATVYAHLAGFVISEDDSVSGGQLIGMVGETGRSSGPHLHFEVRVHGSPVDPLIYLPERDHLDMHCRHGQHNAVWVESLFFRGHDPKKPRRVLNARLVEELAERLLSNGIRYAYMFAGPFGADGSIPDFASSATARATVQRLREVAPDLVVLPWLGGLQHLTVHLQNPQWVDRAIAETARLVADLEVPGMHLDFELILPDCTYVLQEKGLRPTDLGLAEYGAWHIDFHRRLRQRLPQAFISTVIPATSAHVVPWKRQHRPEEAAELAEQVDQLSLLHYDTSIADPEVFSASLVDQLQHIAGWKARPSSSSAQYLIGVGTFINARPLRKYRQLEVERLPRLLSALDQSIADVPSQRRLVDGIAVFCDWTTTRGDWREIRERWVHAAQ